MPRKHLTILLTVFLMACSTPAKYGTVLDYTKKDLQDGFTTNKRLVTKIPNSVANLLTPKINSIMLSGATETVNLPERKFNIAADQASAKSFFF